MCQTPHGHHPCECLWEVPTGTRVEDVGGREMHLHFPNGTTRIEQRCKYTPPAPPVPPATVTTSPCELGFAHAAPMEAFYYLKPGLTVDKFYAQYTVPDPPVNTASNILYYWIGLQDLNSSENPVIQPVLSYVKGSSENNWYFESWNCCPAGHKLKATSVPIAGPGEVLHGSMKRLRSGVYLINSTNSRGDSSLLLSDDSNAAIVRQWNWVDLVLETYNVDSCSQYSSGQKMEFTHMHLLGSDGAAIVPEHWKFAPYIDGKYLPPQESSEFTACCNGKFHVGWPEATMEQNSDAGDPHRRGRGTCGWDLGCWSSSCLRLVRDHLRRFSLSVN